MSAGSTIKTIRNRRGWSQKKLAEKACMSPATIVGYEKEHYEPSVRNFEKILNAMGYELYAKPINNEMPKGGIK